MQQVAVGKLRALGAVDLSVSTRSDVDWYCLTRNLQGSFLKRLEAGIFLKDSLLLGDHDYRYVLALYGERLEVYAREGEYLEAGPSRYGTDMADHTGRKWLLVIDLPLSGLAKIESLTHVARKAVAAPVS
jgi:hypothetical protein